MMQIYFKEKEQVANLNLSGQDKKTGKHVDLKTQITCIFLKGYKSNGMNTVK